MTVPRQHLGRPYTVNPEEPVSQPVAYTRRSLVLFGTVALVLLCGLGLVVAGCFMRWGASGGMIALGVALLAALFVVAKFPSPNRG